MLTEDGRVRRFYLGFDPAKITDRSGVVVLEKLPDGTEETRMILNLRGVGYMEQVKEIIRIVKTRGITGVAIDATGHEPLYEMLNKELGGMVKRVYLTKTEKENLVTDLRLAFQDLKVKLGRQFKYYNLLARELHELDPQKLTHPTKGSDDLFWALALAHHAAKYNYIQARRAFLPLMER